MIEHTPGASPNLSTQILIALDELQEMANRAYWIAGLVPQGTKHTAAIVLSQGRRADHAGVNKVRLQGHEYCPCCRGATTPLGKVLLWRDGSRGYDLAAERPLADVG